jgi:hypothetical protein
MDSMEDLDEFLLPEEEAVGKNRFPLFSRPLKRLRLESGRVFRSFLLVLNQKWEILQQKNLWS